MTSKQAVKSLAKARDLTRRAYANWRAADMKPGTASARTLVERGDRQHAEADDLFDQIRRFLEAA